MGYNDNAAYFERMFPYAKTASAATNLPTSTILAQWGHETGFGTSDVSKNANNHGGIKFVEGISISSGNYGAYAKYSSLDQFVQDYIRVMNLSYYTKIRNAVSPEDTISAFAGSPYAEDQSYSTKVAGIFNTYGLRGYDTYQGGSGTGGVDADDMKKYAAIGIAFVALMALVK
jgi:flagellum-specific peptidoglycan hydrolase FlgJ